MITAALALFGQYRIFVYAAVIVGLVGGIWLHGRSAGVNSMEDNVARAESDAANWKKTAENYKTLIDGHNQAIAAMKEETDKRILALKNNAVSASLESRKNQALAANRADEIRKLKLSGSECENIKSLITNARN